MIFDMKTTHKCDSSLCTVNIRHLVNKNMKRLYYILFDTLKRTQFVKVKVKVKVLPITGHEGPEGE